MGTTGGDKGAVTLQIVSALCGAELVFPYPPDPAPQTVGQGTDKRPAELAGTLALKVTSEMDENRPQ